MSAKSNRVRRQVAEILDALLNPPQDLVDRLNRVQPDSLSEYSTRLDNDWALPVLVGLWDHTLESGKLVELRPAIKLALASLLRTPGGLEKSKFALMQMLRSAGEVLVRRNEEGQARWTDWLDLPGDAQASKYLRIEGARLQTAVDANNLVTLGIPEALHLLAEVLSGESLPSDVAGITPHLARVPLTGRGRDIWEGVYLRVALLLTIAKLDDVYGCPALLPKRIFSQTHLSWGMSSNESSLIFTMDDISKLVGNRAAQAASPLSADGLLTAFPFFPMGDFCVTSSRLLLDSIAPFLLIGIHEANLWKTAVSLPFEESIISLLRDHQFDAASVSERGHWDVAPTNARTERVRAHLRGVGSELRGKMPGEIDVLACRDDATFLIECKSLLGVGSWENIVDNVSSADDGGWMRKIEKKRAWLERAIGESVDLSLILVDGPTILNDRAMDAPAVIANTEILDDLLRSLASRRAGFPEVRPEDR